MVSLSVDTSCEAVDALAWEETSLWPRYDDREFRSPSETVFFDGFTNSQTSWQASR